jgi:hypothetical protein
VSLEAGKRPHRCEKDQQQPVFSDRKPIQNQKINCARVVDAKSRTCAGVPYTAAGEIRRHPERFDEVIRKITGAPACLGCKHTHVAVPPPITTGGAS